MACAATNRAAASLMSGRISTSFARASGPPSTPAMYALLMPTNWRSPVNSESAACRASNRACRRTPSRGPSSSCIPSRIPCRAWKDGRRGPRSWSCKSFSTSADRVGLHDPHGRDQRGPRARARGPRLRPSQPSAVFTIQGTRSASKRDTIFLEEHEHARRGPSGMVAVIEVFSKTRWNGLLGSAFEFGSLRRSRAITTLPTASAFLVDRVDHRLGGLLAADGAEDQRGRREVRPTRL